MNYYNEHDPKTAAWLKQLVIDGLIPHGHVDTRSITEVVAGDLSGYTQCHFFAGIGGWSLALQLAGWPATRPVGTGSCPCQPFSGAGKGLAQADERHLWLVFFDLITACRKLGQSWTDTIFGEQVASSIGHGWLDGISADLEREGYACGAVVLGAHSVGSPHIRQRLYWVANAKSERSPYGGRGAAIAESGADDGAHSTRRMGEPNSDGQHSGQSAAEVARHRDSAESASGGSGGLVQPSLSGLEGHGRDGNNRNQSGWEPTEPGGYAAEAGPSNHWGDYHLIPCRDGKLRRIPTQPALFPLADGLSYKLARRGSVRPALLHGAGNAIVTQVAAEFIKAFESIIQ